MARRSTVKIEARADYSTPFERIPAKEYDEDEHTLWEEGEDDAPSVALADVVGTRQANRLAEAGISTIEEALAYDGDLSDLDGVGKSTAEKILARAE